MNNLGVASIITACVECVLCTGVLFGWPSLQFSLDDEGYFHNLCIENENLSSLQNLSSCTASDESFNLVFTVASSFYEMPVLLFGYILDTFGTLAMRFLATSLHSLGYMLLWIMSPSTSVLLYPAMAMISSSGYALWMSNSQLGNLNPSYRSVFLSISSGMSDLSSIVYLFVKLQHDQGASSKSIFMVLFVITVFPWFRSYFLMPKKTIPYPAMSKHHHFGIVKKLQKTLIVGNDVTENLSESPKQSLEIDKLTISSTQKGKKTLKQCLMKAIFWSNLYHVVVIKLRLSLFYGSVLKWLSSFPDIDVGSFTNWFNVVLLCGVFVAPLNGMVADGLISHFKSRFRAEQTAVLRAYAVSMFLTSTFSVILSVAALARSVYPAFVFVLLTKSFVYSGSGGFLFVAFSTEHYGKLLGITSLVISVFSLAQYAIFKLAVSLDPDFYVINIAMLCLTLTTYVHPIVIFYSSRSS
uniref:Solute carrier family 43 member 3 n=1 Tax=Phallusia mammillata TaxID=59560 RepID=A0A6F9DTI5_9ASCI|nr:solute carrier family 43 member 3 [Phallusia mammillata]